MAVCADFTGTALLYFTFYGLSKHYISKKSPHWIKKITQKIGSLQQRIHKRKKWGIFIGRLTPFLRGYISVAAGTLQVEPKLFLSTVILSAIIWSGGLTITGRILGPYWSILAGKIGTIEFIALIIILVVSLAIAGTYITRRELGKNNNGI